MHRSFVFLPVAREGIILQWGLIMLEDFFLSAVSLRYACPVFHSWVVLLDC